MSLDEFRAEVLVAVGPRGLIVAHDGGERVLAWREGLDGPRALADVFPPGDLSLVESVMASGDRRAVSPVGPPVQVARGDGGTVTVRVEVVPAAVVDGDGWVLRIRPVDETTPAPRDDTLVQLLADRFVSLAESLAAGILIGDSVGHVDYANPAARELLWRTDDQLVGEGWLDTVRADDRRAVRAAAERVRRNGTTEVVDLRVDVVGMERWVQARLTAVTSSTGRPGGWVAILDDVTAERATTDELSRQATHDPLTDLPNRALLNDRLTQAMARVRRSGAPLAVLFIDLNGFKSVNDLHGHRVGDEVLREVATRIRAVIRADDTAARLGGDEFVVVAEGVDAEIAHQVAARLDAAIAAPISVGERQFVVSGAIGVAWASPDATDPAELLDRADRAMYDAKRSDDSVVFAPEP